MNTEWAIQFMIELSRFFERSAELADYKEMHDRYIKTAEDCLKISKMIEKLVKDGKEDGN